MYNKIQNLNNLKNEGFNVHRFFVPESWSECLFYVTELKQCTIRTDHATRTEDLPFYILDINKNDIKEIMSIWDIAKNNEYKLLISDGIKYDKIQEYNMVVKIHKNGNFEFEASELKVPLRHMYKYPLLSCSGNIAEEVSEWHIYSQKYNINKLDIKRDLLDLYNYQIFDRWLEVTKYPIPVGIQNKQIIFWQILDVKKGDI